MQYVQYCMAASGHRRSACHSSAPNPVCCTLPTEQVATDTRLWLYGQLHVIRGALNELINVSCDRSAAEVDVLMPGFTHLQPAMTVRWSHWVMCHSSAWQRDDMRLRDLMPRVATLPLGSGGHRGSGF